MDQRHDLRLHPVPHRREAVLRVAVRLSCMLLSAGLAVSAAFAIRVQSATTCHHTSGQCANALLFFGNEDGEFIATLVVVGLSGILSLVWILHLLLFRLPSLLRSCCAWSVDGHSDPASSFGQALLQRVRLLCAKRAPDPDAQKIRDEYERQRLRRVCSFASKSCPVLIFFLLLSTYVNVFGGLENGLPLRLITWQYLFHNECVALFISSAWIVAVDMYPSVLTPVVSDSINIMLSAMWSWKLATTTENRYEYNKYWIIGGRVMQVTVFGNAQLTSLLNMITLFADCMTMLAQDALDGQRIYREIFIVCLLCVLGYILDQQQWSEAKSTVLVQKSSHAAALVQQALSCMCDAVPRLDAELRLAEPCPRLSALLLRNGPLMPGMEFTNLMSGEDAELLRSCIASHSRFPRSEDVAAAGKVPAGGEAVKPRGFSGLCHVTLRGANNLELPVSLFYSCVLDGDGAATFLLGIRENHEEGQAPAAAAGSAAAPAAGLQDALGALPEACATESIAASSSAWSASDISSEQGDALCVWVDGADGSLRVLRSSFCFALLGGASGPCQSLMEWLSIGDFTKLCNELDSGGVPSAEVRVRLRPPVGPVYRCTVSLEDAEGSVVAAQPVRIVFHIVGSAERRRAAQHAEGTGGEAPHISASGRLGGAYRSSNTKALGKTSRQVSRVDAEISVDLHDGMPIGPLHRGAEQEELLRGFAEHRRLQDWLEDPLGFLDALQNAVRSFLSDELAEAVAREVGTFTFRRPGSPSHSARFTACVWLLLVSRSADAPYPIRLGLRHVEWLQDAARPQEGGKPAAASAHQALRAASVEPQLIGSPFFMAL